ncbi:MAG TPA: ABC transporter substrate-binding protein [Natronosporangium sp.]
MRTRRSGLLAVAMATMLVLAAACGDDGDGGGGGDNTEVEVFTWWTGPGEGEGLAELERLFTEANPDIEFINAAVAGGGGEQARALLTNRMQANDPPDSFQGHAGKELLDYIEAGQLEDLTYLYEQEGWLDVFPEDLIEQVTVDGKIYSVPVNIHRANLLWFNPETLNDLGIEAPPTTWSEFLDQAQEIQAAGKIPLAIGPLWTQEHLLETVLLGELGPEAYTGLWDGTTSWTDPSVVAAMEVFSDVLDVSDLDEAASDWQPQLDKLVNGSAAYAVMGDWAFAYLDSNLGLTYEQQYNAVASPGSDGVFDWLSDSFTIPVGAQNKEAAEEWLRICGSREGQDAFNVLKGSVPARTDADTSLYTDYLAWNLPQWTDPNTVLVPSLAHGAAASNAFKNQIEEHLGTFVGDRDAVKFTENVQSAYESTSG